MAHLPELIRDLCFILVTAAVVTLVFRKLRQPVVLGYLIAGFLLGPHVPYLPTVTDVESIKVWAEIGIIFLLFGLGLEFSFKKLAQVGKSASITAVFEILFMLGLGYFVGQVFGWSKMDSLFLGGILSISSTTIIVRAFDELGLKTRRFVSLVFGVLIVEDLVAILLLVLLTTVAATQTLSGTELTQATLKLGFFLILWFVVGIYLIPIFLQKIRSLMTSETMLIVSIGLCLMMVLLATAAGFSPALGAFVMGSILAETRDGKAIEHVILPVKDLFAAVFFVSVGMLIDPQVIYENFRVVVVLTVVTIFGKFLSSVFGALVSGQSLKHSVQAGMSLAQIGEFSFIIATLGISLNVTSSILYPIAVAVSAVTTFTTPYQIKYADSFYGWLEKRIPEAMKRRLDDYQAAIRAKSDDHLAAVLWKLYGLKILLNSVVIVAISLIVSQVARPIALNSLGDQVGVHVGICLLSLLACAPFFWPIVFAQPSQATLKSISDIKTLRYLQVGVVFFRVMLAVFLVGFIVSQFFSIVTASGAIAILFTVTLVVFNRHIKTLYAFFEDRFLKNLREKESHELAQAEKLPALAPWDATMTDFVLSQDSDLVGKTLMESRLKESFGVTLVLIERGQKRIMAPGRDELLLPYDRLFLIGSEQQLEAAKARIEGEQQPLVNLPIDYFGLDSLVVRPHSDFAGKRIRESGLRERIEGLIVGIERGGERILSPDSSVVLAAGDIVWVVGDKNRIRIAKA